MVHQRETGDAAFQPGAVKVHDHSVMAAGVQSSEHHLKSLSLSVDQLVLTVARDKGDSTRAISCCWKTE